jgi:hypothetical protein
MIPREEPGNLLLLYYIFHPVTNYQTNETPFGFNNIAITGRLS